MKCWRLLLFMILASSSLVLAGATQVHVAKVKCGTTIPIDSHPIAASMSSFGWLPLTLRLFRNPIKDLDMSFAWVPINKIIADIIRSEAGMSLSSLIIFELEQQRNSLSECKFFWNPLMTTMDSVEITAVRVLAIDGFSSNVMCGTPVGVELKLNSKMIHAFQVGSRAGVTSSNSFSARVVRWPIVVQVQANCSVYMLLMTNQQGSIHRWYVWIPLTVYTGVVVLLVFTAVLFQRTLSPGVTAVVMTLVFVGYLGSCVGLVVEVLMWRSALGRVFPFPSAVTLHCCVPFFYLLLFVLLLLRHPHRGILLNMLLRLAIYGLNCALCCGYWIAGDVLLGVLALLQFLLSNIFLLATYSYFVIILERAELCGGSVSGVLGFLWFAPFIPFAPCILMYFDLYIIDENKRDIVGVPCIVKKYVTIYNTLTSFPLLLLQNVWGIVLLAVATMYHIPLLIVFFGALFLFGIHFSLSVCQYAREHRRLKSHGDFVDGGNRYSFCCDWYLLWVLMENCVRKAYHQAVMEANNTRRELTSVAASGNTPVRVLSEIPVREIDRTTLNEMACFPSSTTVDNERDPRKELYWPASIGL